MFSHELARSLLSEPDCPVVLTFEFDDGAVKGYSVEKQVSTITVADQKCRALVADTVCITLTPLGE